MRTIFHRFQLPEFGGRVALAAVVIFHLALVIPLSGMLNIWIDEAFTLQSTGGGFVHAVQRALYFEKQPPLYFLVLTLWRIADDSLFFARIFSVLCTTSTVFIASGLARRYLPGVPAALVTAVVAFNPLTVYAAVEARFYALVLLLAALLMLFFYDGYLAAKPSPAARRWHTVVAIVSLYTHYFLGFLLVAGGVALLLLGSVRLLRKYVVGMTITAVIFVPLAMITVRQVESVLVAPLRPQTLTEGARLIWNTIWRSILPVNQDSPLMVVRSWISRLLPLVVVLAALARRRQPTMPLLALLNLVGVVGLFYLGVAMRLGPEFTQLQYTVVLSTPLLLAALALLQYVGGVWAAISGTMVSLLLASLYIFGTYAPLAKQGDWVRVSHYIERHETVSEPILVFRSVYVLDFGYHYAGHNRLVPIPSLPSSESYDLASYILHDELQILGPLRGQLGATRRFWLVTTQTEPFRGIDVHPEILERFVAQRCKTLRDESFWKSRVRLLELQPEAESGTNTVDDGKDARNEPRNSRLRR